MSEVGMTNGYPDPDQEIANLKLQLAQARQQLAWCNKPWDNYKEWEQEVASLEKQLRLMGAEHD